MTDHDPDRPQAGRYVGGEHRFAVRVYFEDTDAGGLVYHANYLRYMERARSDMIALLGVDAAKALRDGEGVYVVTRVAIDYRRPAKLGDALVIASTLMELRAASSVIHQQVIRDGEVLVEATVQAAFVGPNGRPRRQPAAWLAAFEGLKGSS